MNTLISLLFMQKLTRGNSKKFKRNFKKKNAPSILILKNLGLVVYCVFEFIFTTIHSVITPKKAVFEVKSKNVVSFEKYKNKKTKATETVFNLQVPNKLS